MGGGFKEAMTQRKFDVIIIGTGAGGGTLAFRLARTGKKILILERGGFLPKENDNWNTQAVFTRSKYKAHEIWLDKSERAFHPGIYYYVGGCTKMYGAALLRLRKQDFEEMKHYEGVSPAWPISYDDLEPYYTQAEELYHVHGQAGIDPTEPPRSKPFFYPPLEQEPRIRRLFEEFKKKGCHPFPLPMGVVLGRDKPYPQPECRIGLFDGFPDPTESKADAHVIAINPILAQSNITLKTQSYVEKLVTDPSGQRIAQVHADENGEKIIYTGNIVVVSCGAVNSAALLLRSASDKHPQGLANRSNVVGRYYMCHNNSMMLAVSKEPNPTLFGKTFAINDYYLGCDDWDFPLGHIQMVGKSNAEMLKGDAPCFVPGIMLDYIARHAIDFGIISEDLPDRDNRVSLDRQGRIKLSYTKNNLQGHQRLKNKLKDLLEHMGCKNFLTPRNLYLGKQLTLQDTAHQCGTVRFGKDPQMTALDINCKAHDLENLYVVDGSFFVSSGAVNPALTIMANALRVGDHLSRLL